MIKWFRHNDMEHLDSLLKEQEEEDKKVSGQQARHWQIPNGGLDWGFHLKDSHKVVMVDWTGGFQRLRSQSGNGGLDREYSTEIMITKW